MNKKTSFVELQDIKLAYTENGSGKPVILLHGNSQSRKIFKKYQNQYLANFKTFAIDTRGHGESKTIDEILTFDKISDDIIKFCEKKELKGVYVLGFSDGGNIALFLASKRPDLFEKLVMVSPNYLVSGTTESAMKILESINKISVFLCKIGFHAESWIKRFDLMFRDIGLSDKDLASIKSNVLFLYAEKDMIKEEHIVEMNNLVPGSERKMISDCMQGNILSKKEAQKSIVEYFRA
jgi:esterase/lipase